MGAPKITVRAGVDYLVMSKVQNERPFDLTKEVALALETTGEQVHWQHGYHGVECCGNYGQALFRQSRSDGGGDVLIRLPGRALEWIRERNVLSEGNLNTTDADICRYFVDQGFCATRIDVALDTNDPAVSPKLVEEYVKAGAFTCRAKRAGVTDDWELARPETQGQAETFVLGSRSSTRYLRVYNKRAKLLKDTGKDPGHLTRFELEVKAEAATKVLKFMAQRGADGIPSVFRGWVRFKDLNDTNPRLDRRDEADWWLRLVASAEPLVLGLTRNTSTPERKLRWLTTSVAKTLVLAEAFGCVPEIMAAKESKQHRITKSEMKQWAHFARMRDQGKGSSQSFGSWS